MESKFKITIPKPCHQDWNAMTPEETGRFCNSCTKTVVDFTKMKTLEIQDYFVQNQNQKICGRFKNKQVNRFDIYIPQSILRQRMPFQKVFLLTLFITMGTTLFSCKNHNDAALGEVVVIEDTLQNKSKKLLGDTTLVPIDTIKEVHTMGLLMPPKNDSITRKK